MSDLDHDLYGDLDLEDLDATQLEEELVDPETEPFPAPAEYKPDVSAFDAAGHAGAAPPAGGASVPPAPGQPPQLQYGINQFPGQQQAQGFVPHETDRIKQSDVPDEGKMFIGGLNWETTDDGLRAYFSAYGDIDQCTIMRDPTGRSRGFAFLTFKDAASVQKVLDKDHQLDGKMIDPKRAIPRAEHERTAKVFVGGLAPTVTSESLKHFLGQFGKVMDATVMFDRLNGRSKGFAFATFADEDGVEVAMRNSGIELEGRQIEIKKAQPRGAGTQPKAFTAPGGARSYNPASTASPASMALGGAGAGGGLMAFDPGAMAMMYQNMMKGGMMGMGGGLGMGGAGAMGMGAMGGMGGMGAMGGAFDPSAMAMMYQNMMKGMGMGGAAPAINPSMAASMMGRNMGGMGMGGGMMNGGMGMGMNGGMGMGMNGMGMRNQARPPAAPRGPASMRGPSGIATPMSATASGSGAGGAGPGAGAAGAAAGAANGAGAGAAGGSGPQRYSTQGQQRARPY
ncbi:hypothetical protein Q5752_002666 [Cryptotrichosporon argae]